MNHNRTTLLWSIVVQNIFDLRRHVTTIYIRFIKLSLIFLLSCTTSVLFTDVGSAVQEKEGSTEQPHFALDILTGGNGG